MRQISSSLSILIYLNDTAMPIFWFTFRLSLGRQFSNLCLNQRLVLGIQNKKSPSRTFGGNAINRISSLVVLVVD